MFFTLFFIAALTGRVALDYYASTPFIGKIAGWLIPTVDVVVCVLAALTLAVAVIKLIKIVHGDGGTLEVGVVFAVALASVVMAGILSRTNAVLTPYLVYYALAAGLPCAVFVLALIFGGRSRR